MSIRNVETIIEAVVRNRFPASVIKSVEVTHGADDDGDRTLHVIIVFNGAFENLDKQRMFGLVRHIRTELGKSGETDFPIVDFVSTVDAAKLKREIA